MNKLILNFKSKESKKIKNPKILLGGKGVNLSEMGKIGVPVARLAAAQAQLNEKN